MEWPFLISAPHLVMLYISTKFREIILNSIKVIERTPFLYWKLQRAKNVGGVNIVNLCTSSGHALCLCQLSWNYLERYQSYRADTISILKITKGNNSAKNVGGVTVVNLCMLSGHALYFYQVLWNYLKQYQSYRADTISIPKISKGNNSAKNVGGVTVVDLCTSSGHALYFYQVLWNYLKRYQSYWADTISILKITKGNNSAKNVFRKKCRWSDGCWSLHVVWSCFIFLPSFVKLSRTVHDFYTENYNGE